MILIHYTVTNLNSSSLHTIRNETRLSTSATQKLCSCVERKTRPHVSWAQRVPDYSTVYNRACGSEYEN